MAGLDRAFLSMLTARPLWASYTGGDQWGNDTWAVPVAVEAYVEGIEWSSGVEDGQSKQDNERVGNASMICNYHGIKPKDRVTIPTGDVMSVSAATTEHDEVGVPLFQTVQMTTQKRG